MRNDPAKRRVNRKRAAKKRHELARTRVDVYRLFKVRDAAAALQQADDPVISELARQIHDQARTMLTAYVKEQAALMTKRDEEAHFGEDRS